MNNIKLVIWDLDETFWRGTLAEGKVEKIQRNIDIVKGLIDRGIMCSIVSKNNYEDAMKQLDEYGITDLFVFPQISWNPKGVTVKKLLETCKLRAENVLFLDDNPSNVEEVRFYNNGINAELPSFLDQDIFSLDAFKGKNDANHTRLEQYKILERRTKAEEESCSNIDFLRASNIIVAISEDCLSEEKRIFELIERTNQLNYTKKRISAEQLHELILNPMVETGYITVKDNFGDYGITGFYALRKDELIHFLFSCRILGFGIENYLWNKLGQPKICPVGEVATVLDSKFAQSIDWIKSNDEHYYAHKDENLENFQRKKRKKKLMIGGCDLEQAAVYLASNYSIKKEFATVVNGCEVRTSDTSTLVGIRTIKKEIQDELCLNLPFLNSKISFKSEIFDNTYDILVISVVDDYIRGMYRHNEHQFLIGYGGYFDQAMFYERLSEKEKEYLDRNFIFEGKESTEIFQKNLEYIISNINPKAKVIIINGIDLDVTDWIGEDRIQRNLEMNAIVDLAAKKYTNVSVCDMRNIVVSRDMLTKHDNRHFNRAAYYSMAQELTRLINSQEQDEALELKNYYYLEVKLFLQRLKKKMERLFRW